MQTGCAYQFEPSREKSWHNRVSGSNPMSCHCCDDLCIVRSNETCLLPDIARSYYCLQRRHRRMITKNPVILRLAEPKNRKNRFYPECLCPSVALRKVEIVRMDLDERKYTRTEQLSYPSVRSLLSLQNTDSFRGFNTDRKKIVNRLIRKSLHSLYSRLSNTQPPPKHKPINKWSEDDWKEHMQRISVLAKPKSLEPKKKKKSKKPIIVEQKKNEYSIGSSMTASPPKRRFLKLARPKKYEEYPDVEWHLSNHLRNYTPSKRLIVISQPKGQKSEMNIENPFEVKKSALYSKPSERIRELSTSNKKKQFIVEDFKENPFKVARNALRAKPSDRVIKLAEPKSISDTHTRANPYGISRKALKARITPRLLELAQPKTHV